jgi:hypothetical protein
MMCEKVCTTMTRVSKKHTYIRAYVYAVHYIYIIYIYIHGISSRKSTIDAVTYIILVQVHLNTYIKVQVYGPGQPYQRYIARFIIILRPSSLFWLVYVQ